MSFANLKRQSGNLSKLQQAVEALNQNPEAGSDKSENFWKPEVDKAGNGMAVIRFLPASEKDGDDAAPDKIIIDDTESVIEQWKAKGGIGILHKDWPSTLAILAMYV